MPHRPDKIISGGQTGVDRAALDIAIEFDIEPGGHVPRGRRAEDGEIPARYRGLVETSSTDPAERTRLNVACADCTLILAHGALSGGTLFTREMAEAQGKPVLVVDLDQCDAATAIAAFLDENRPRVLNIAGPRGSEDPLAYADTLRVLRLCIAGQVS